MSSVIGMICFCKEGREATPDLATSPRRQAQGQGPNGGNTRPKDPPPMVVQGDFRKVDYTFKLLRSDDVYKLPSSYDSFRLLYQIVFGYASLFVLLNWFRLNDELTKDSSGDGQRLAILQSF